MEYREVKGLTLHSTGEEKLLFEVRWLTERVRNLELIVHELMRGRINKEIVDGWLNSAHDKGNWTPSVNQIEGRGAQIAALLDQFPPEAPAMEWPKKPPLG